MLWCIHCLLCLGVFVWSLLFYAVISVLLDLQEDWTGCFTSVVFLMSSGCQVAVSLPHITVG